MDGRFSNPFVSEREEPETAVGSTFSGVVAADGKTRGAVSSPKRRRAVQKRVVSVPIGDTEGSRMKGEGAPPPSDSWAWRKYGQKPIKGSPYPRGYYRCSSSKGCPARKQVERSRTDPTMLVITYACDHNHPWPVPKNSSNNNTTNATSTTKLSPDEPAVFSNPAETDPDEKFGDLGEDSFALKTDGDYYWFSDVASSSSPAKETVLESPICAGNSHADVAVLFPIREEDESLFADLGELPECSVVFRRGILDNDEESRQCTLRAATWCGSTG